jgi:radical SAM superfamily enzyme YgiQ (UPF0313 family)
MKIALLAPAGAMHRYNGMFHKNLHYAPITLALLAALVPEELGADVKIYDETAEKVPLDLEADIVAITCITGTASRCYKYADYFRKRGMKVVLGGVHPSLKPYEAMEHADSVVVGLGENNFPRVLKDFQEGYMQKLYFQGEDTTVENRPLPRKDLLKEDKYITLNTVEAIRGCNLNCTFCAYPKAFGNKLYKRTVKNIIDEIKTLNGKIVVFPDVNLIADTTFAKELFKEMIPLKKWWFGLTTSAIGVDDELLDLFEKSGCKGLLIGFESVNQETQKSMRKGVNKVYEYELLMDKLHSHGIMVMGCFAFGSDDDEIDVFLRTVNLCLEAKIDLPRFSVITPFPGTDYYRQLEMEKRIIETDWSMYDVEHVVYKPKNMTVKELEEGIKWAWNEAYSFKNIIRRIDIKNLWKINVLYGIYFGLNFGYKKYAESFEAYGKTVMADNSDIPD